MRKFLIDENLNARKFYRACLNRTSRARVIRYPRKLKQENDDVLLSRGVFPDQTLVTFDRAIAEENPEFIRPDNCGIVIVSNSPAVGHTITQKQAGRILSRFKDSFPLWDEISLANSVVDINESYVVVERLSPDGLTNRKVEHLNDPEFATKLARILTENAAPR